MTRKDKRQFVPWLRVVGDIHSQVREYVQLVKHCNHSLQIGDLTIFPTGYVGLTPLDPKKHKWIPGNHDCYDTAFQSPHCLGDFGEFTLGGFNLYFIRGAFSIDYRERIKAEKRGHTKSWWEEEQLSQDKMYAAFEDYEKKKPNVVITHTCPAEIAKLIGKPGILKMFGYNPNTFTTRTQSLLQECFEAHQPSLWIFGHFHQNRAFQYKGTNFVCLDELQPMDFDKKGRYNHNGIKGSISS